MSNNLVQNPGFETGDFTAWSVLDPDGSSQYPDIGIDNYPGDVNSGNYGVFAGDVGTTTLSQEIATIPGHDYTVSFYLDVDQAAAIDGGMTATFDGQTVTNLVEPVETDYQTPPFTQYTATIEAHSSLSQLEFSFTDPGGFFGFDDVSVTDNAACYVRGTHILTDSGEVPIERLKAGDMVLTASGQAQPVRWLGHRGIDCTRYSDPSVVWPICIKAGAFGACLPTRDLMVSPGHSVLVDGVLIQADKLINDATVLRVPRAQVEYWHVELDSHDILVAEGLPSESYLDTGNRTAFVNGGAYLDAHPDFKPKHWADTCVPLALEGAAVHRAKTALLERAQALGYAMTDDADAHVIVDGKRVEPVRLGADRLAFLLPPGSSIELRSRSFIPSYMRGASDDARALGLCVSRFQLNGADLDLGDETAFSLGWYALESAVNVGQWRWSTDRVPLPAGTRLVVMDLAGRGCYWNETARGRIALVS